MPSVTQNSGGSHPQIAYPATLERPYVIDREFQYGYMGTWQIRIRVALRPGTGSTTDSGPRAGQFLKEQDFSKRVQEAKGLQAVRELLNEAKRLSAERERRRRRRRPQRRSPRTTFRPI